MDHAPDVTLGSFSIPPGHPCLDGHFPEHPLVPGVVLLDEALARLRAHLRCGPPVRLQSVKFLSPVLPGDAVQMAVRGTAAGRDRGVVGFSLLVRGNPVVTGSAGFAPGSS
jgi:3-hydroxymyristoyl/3-hydroxydecanoyl-(acyl carrier protein) dehydratase